MSQMIRACTELIFILEYKHSVFGYEEIEADIKVPIYNIHDSPLLSTSMKKTLNESFSEFGNLGKIFKN